MLSCVHYFHWIGSRLKTGELDIHMVQEMKGTTSTGLFPPLPLSYADSSRNIKTEKFIYYIKAIFSLLIPAFLGLHCLAVSP